MLSTLADMRMERRGPHQGRWRLLVRWKASSLFVQTLKFTHSPACLGVTTRCDFPVIKNPYDADIQGSKKIAKHVLNEMGSEIFLKLKMGTSLPPPPPSNLFAHQAHFI